MHNQPLLATAYSRARTPTFGPWRSESVYLPSLLSHRSIDPVVAPSGTASKVVRTRPVLRDRPQLDRYTLELCGFHGHNTPRRHQDRREVQRKSAATC